MNDYYQTRKLHLILSGRCRRIDDGVCHIRCVFRQPSARGVNMYRHVDARNAHTYCPLSVYAQASAIASLLLPRQTENCAVGNWWLALSKVRSL